MKQISKIGKKMYYKTEEYKKDLAIVRKIYFIFFFALVILIIILIWNTILFPKFSLTYNMNWPLKISEPISFEYIINTNGRDPTIFSLLTYNKKDIEKLLKNQSFKPIDKEFIENFITNTFKKNFTEEENNTFEKYFDWDMLNNNNNYYAYITKIPAEDKSLLIVDVEKNIIYSLEWFI